MSTIRYCVNGCKRVNADGKREPAHATIGQVCALCLDRLDKWLREIPDRYAMLPDYVLPTADLDANPESKATKRAHAPAPLRLGALDLLDTRRGRKWLGTEPTEDRRGALGTLLAIATYIRQGRNTSTRLKPTVSREASTILLNLEWLVGDDLIRDAYQELRILHRDLGAATNQYPPKPVGTCTVVTEDAEDEAPCGGPLLPVTKGVVCPRCGTHWDHSSLRLLGRTLSETA